MSALASFNKSCRAAVRVSLYMLPVQTSSMSEVFRLLRLGFDRDLPDSCGLSSKAALRAGAKSELFISRPLPFMTGLENAGISEGQDILGQRIATGPSACSTAQSRHSSISFSLVCAWSSMGFYMSLWQAALKGISHEIIEASAIDGCSRSGQVFRIILPMIRDNIASICIFVLTAALKIYEVVFILTGGGPMHASETIVSYLYVTTFDSMLYGYGMTIAVAEFVFAVLISLVSLRISRRNEA